MTPGSTQPKWDIFEAVVLLDGYLEVLQGNHPKSHIIKRISADLRDMAINRGIEIDDIYRNENGISFQIQSMESAYKGKNVYVPATKLFDEAVMLYRTDKQRYLKTLEKAKSMIEAKHNNMGFSAVDIYSNHMNAFGFPTETAETSYIVDFENIQSLAFTRPTEFSYFDEVRKQVDSWTELYVQVVKLLLDDYPHLLYSYMNRNISGRERFDFADEAGVGSMIAPKRVQDNFFIETNCNATEIVRKIKKLLDLCRVDYDNLKMVYEKRSGEKTYENKPIITRAHSACEDEFCIYLQNTAKLARGTCSSYVSAIRSAERYAQENGYKSCSLFSKDKAATVAAAAELYSDPDFIRYNEQRHNRFSAAINKLLESIGAEIPGKAVASIGIDREQTPSIPEANREIASLLKQRYKYGFKYNSLREIMRLRQYADEMGVELPEDDDTLKSVIMASGTVIDDKVYCKSDDTPLELQQIIDDIFASGVGVIYYESLFENNSEWMENHVITSSDILKKYLQKNTAGCSFSKKFMVKGKRRSEREAVTYELKRVWSISPSESVNELHDRLPYIPVGNIWRVISGNDLFVRVSEGEYLYIDRFIITEDEEKGILDFVETACNENGYASLSDVPIGEIKEEYYRLPQFAIYNAIYKKVLSDKYHLNGKILTKEKSELDAVALLKLYIKDKDECTFDEVSDKAIELTGDINRQFAFRALYDDMVRVDKNRFIANRFVNFNVDEIDAALSRFITDGFRAIREVTTFAMFPICGQSWNHYLLESFCYKYSKKYSLRVIHFNDKNAGIIAENDYNKTYNEMLAIELSRSDIELVPDIIGQYLFNIGYMAKSKYAKLDEIAQQASILRKER